MVLKKNGTVAVEEIFVQGVGGKGAKLGVKNY